MAQTGALTKLAELLPGSNLLAAAMLHARGHHREAQEALKCGAPSHMCTSRPKIWDKIHVHAAYMI